MTANVVGLLAGDPQSAPLTPSFSHSLSLSLSLLFTSFPTIPVSRFWRSSFPLERTAGREMMMHVGDAAAAAEAEEAANGHMDMCKISKNIKRTQQTACCWLLLLRPTTETSDVIKSLTRCRQRSQPHASLLYL